VLSGAARKRVSHALRLEPPLGRAKARLSSRSWRFAFREQFTLGRAIQVFLGAAAGCSAHLELPSAQACSASPRKACRDAASFVGASGRSSTTSCAAACKIAFYQRGPGRVDSGVSWSIRSEKAGGLGSKSSYFLSER
jgi:hypothetical protein